MTTTAVFDNARVLTMDPRAPRAAAVLVDDHGLVAEVAGRGGLARLPAGAERHDCGGALLVPAFVDAHCHVLAAAAALRSVDCSPAAVRSIRDIQARLREAAAWARDGAWLRAAGYDETRLDERRHPTCRDLDDVVPHLPVRLLHRSGHAVVLNTRAMQLAGIAVGTPEPPGGYIERFADSGEPTGLLLEMNDAVDRVVPPLAYDDLAAGVAEVSARCLQEGVTAVCDATHTNGRREWELFARLQAEGHLPIEVTLMEGLAHAGEMPADAGGRLRRGHVKVMLGEVGGLSPDEDELARIVREVHASGRDVAVHAVEERAVVAAVAAIEGALASIPRAHRHRIEHAGLLPRGAAQRMARAGVSVVTQPAFVYYNGDRYLRDVPAAKHGRLYALASLVRAGVRVAASSDAPVTPPGAVAGIDAAMRRRSEGGAALGPAQAVSFGRAVSMWTREAAWATRQEAERGRIAPGMAADFVLLSRDAGRPRVLATFVRGRRVVPLD